MRRFARSLRTWLEGTHSARFELQRHFLLRFFDLDFASTPGQWQTLISGTLVILAPLSQLYVQPFFHKYMYLNSLADAGPYQRAVRADVLFIIVLAMVVAGIVTALQWSSLFPSLRDYLALASLPIRMRDVFLAHFTVILCLALMFTHVMVASPSVVLPMIMHGRQGEGIYYHIPGIYLSGTLAGWFVFFSLIAAQGVLLNVLPLRHFSRISLFVQSTVLIVLLCAIPWVLTIPDALNYMDRRPVWAFFAPPLWFLGLDQVIAGNSELFVRQLAKLALAGTFGSFLTAIAVYLWSYRRHRVRVLESPDLRGKTARLLNLENFAGRFLSRPQELAVWSFVVKTLARSRQHRLILAAFAALAFALCSELLIGEILNPGIGGVSANAVSSRQTAISIPLAFSLFTLCGFRYVFRLPFELKANWIFRLYTPGNQRSFIAAIEKVFLYCGVAPLALLAVAVETRLLGLRPGIFAASACVLASLILVEVLLWSFQTIPFTSSYFPGQRTPLQTILRYAMGVVIYVWAYSTVVERSLTGNGAKIALMIAASLIWSRSRAARKRTEEACTFEFEELGEPAVRRLHLNSD